MQMSRKMCRQSLLFSKATNLCYKQRQTGMEIATKWKYSVIIDLAYAIESIRCFNVYTILR